MPDMPAPALPDTDFPVAGSLAPPPLPWPAGPLAGPEGVHAPQGPQPCEIEGHNNRLMRGRLVRFDPTEEAVHLQVPSGRVAITVRFAQFRSLMLLEPLTPSSSEAHQPSRYHVTMKTGAALEGETLDHVEAPHGLFLFPWTKGTVTRLFVPRDSYIRFVLNSQASPTPTTRPVGTPQELLAALEQQSRMRVLRLGETMVSLGILDNDTLHRVLEQQKSQRHVPLGALLVQQGLVSAQDLQAALAHKMGYPLVNVLQFPVDSEALRQIPYLVARRLNALPLLVRGDARLVVAFDDPSQGAAIEELEFVSQLKVLPVLAQEGVLADAVHLHYERLGVDVGTGQARTSAMPELEPGDTHRLVETLERDSAGGPGAEEDPQIEQSDNSLVRLIHNMIIEAHSRRVSDIHIECYPGREKIKVRFRRDGVLQPYLELPHNYRNALIARLKIMCDLDISERRKPQDGKINFSRFVPGHKLELRVATVPTYDGLEDVVMRLLSSARPIPLDQIGLSEDNLARLGAAIERPYGMVLCVGPTGSGKTTTLHSALGRINVPERKIWTAEDPVEITQRGLRQVQVNPRLGWTFAQALRAFLRADPDVIMVGEIRDEETARIAIEASLTGHLVLSTMHTNSAPDTVTRLLDMGLDPFNFADSLLAVLAQRLVRKLCPHCRQTRPAADSEIEELMSEWLQACPPEDPRFTAEVLRGEWQQRFGRDGQIMLHRSPGCDKCEHTGFFGRTSLHELLVVSRELSRLIQTRARAEQLQQQAMREGLRTLRQDGIDKVLQGLTTLAEVRATSNA